MTSIAVVSRVPLPPAVSGVSQALYDKVAAFRDDLVNNIDVIQSVLPVGVRAESLASVALNACVDNPALLDCSALSLFRSVYKAASLNLRIGETCDVVPIKGKAECWVRVKGVVELAMRSGAIRFARDGFVVEGDHFEHEERSEGTHFVHRSGGATAARDLSNVTHLYAIITLTTGQRVYEVWPIAKCLAHRDRYGAGKMKPGSAWAEHTGQMISKAVVKAALRFAPLSPEMRRTIDAGDTVPEGSFEVVGNADPEAALALASGSLDALAAMDGPPEPMTLDEAEAMTLPGAPDNPKVWGGKGGACLGDLKDQLLSSVAKWVRADAERATKYARLALAAECIIDARADDAATAEIAA